MITIPTSYPRLFHYCRHAPSAYHFAMKTYALNALCTPSLWLNTLDEFEVDPVPHLILYVGQIRAEFVPGAAPVIVSEKLGYEWRVTDAGSLTVTPSYIWHLL